MEPKVYINGKLYPKEDAKVSVFDHGLLYGDGVFEGIRCYNGSVFKLSEHIDRLYDSAEAIALEIGLTKDALKNAVLDTLEANNLRDSYIRLVVTRGVGKLGLDPFNCETPQLIIITDTIQLYSKELYEKGLDVIIVHTIRNHPDALSPTVKSMNYLNNILAKIECIKAGAAEGIMLNKDGYVAECTGDNIFIVKDNEIFTPPVSAGILIGITRNVVIELAKEAGTTVREEQLTQEDLYNADECFLTGTAAEIIPVANIDGKKVSTGKPGKITLSLLKKYQELTSAHSSV
ncbi:MAG: branched-chain-amino-acid transaminase [Candidatus Scalindua sp.]|jgi:branched-chain amino acid aminotransferase|nr:branched-chain-amino-acid transaminase [Candidatus Scalindua sp.]MBT5304449.1 branched-chain-amino-acid transaminase [Candidatus Scalindua sp.]MBT6049737.1 branched-chain-amino-acid transaminase [Candidatus Scalindua sp.]MBT6227046.1 branched-chain-amino-acid transaminase [Candidatus Scalindua sp.]MBT6563746.1 branched-chain-amino-acid transaminase [Candidatus Scalindua sp.]